MAFAEIHDATAAALCLLHKKEKYGYMLALKNTEIVSVPLEEIAGKLKTVDPDSGIVKEARIMGISFGDEE